MSPQSNVSPSPDAARSHFAPVAAAPAPGAASAETVVAAVLRFDPSVRIARILRRGPDCIRCGSYDEKIFVELHKGCHG